MATITAVIGGSITTEKLTVGGNVSAKRADLAGGVRRNSYPLYDGEYEITPTDEPQVIELEGKAVKQNIIINPIPSNYGKVIWNGTTLTIL